MMSDGEPPGGRGWLAILPRGGPHQVVTGPKVRRWGFWCGGERFVPRTQFDSGCGKEQQR